MLLEESKERLATYVPELDGRIEEAASLATLMQRNQLPQVTPAAFLLPLGLRGGLADTMAGMFRQGLERVMGVVLIFRSVGDAIGAKAFDRLSPLIDAVISTFAGWGPEGAIGVFRLGRGELLSMQAGTIVYQLDFILDDQLRI